jgi:hypothetical protein
VKSLVGSTSLSVPVDFGSYGSLYNTSTFTVAKSFLGDDKYSGQLAGSSEMHYTNATELGSGFVDAYLGAEISANQTYNQSSEYSSEVGFYTGVSKTKEGNYMLTPKFGPHLTVEKGERENSHFSLDAALTAGIAAGTKLSDCETSVYAYGRGYKELTNNHNFHTEFGVGIGKPVEIFGADINLSAEVGYGKNWSGATTNNFIKRQDGVCGRIGVSVDL